MPEAPKKQNNRPPKQNNRGQNEKYEVNSYTSSFIYTDYYFGLNIFDFYTPEQLQDIVRDPMANNAILRELSLILYGTNGVYTNTVDYMTALPTLDKVIVPHGKNTKKKKQNKELMISTLRKIRDKEFVRDALFRGMIEGTAFYYFETTEMPNSNRKFLNDYDVNSIVEINDFGINASIISLPADYTEIVGRKNDSYVLAFNLDYITNAVGESAEQKLKKLLLLKEMFFMLIMIRMFLKEMVGLVLLLLKIVKKLKNIWILTNCSILKSKPRF